MSTIHASAAPAGTVVPRFVGPEITQFASHPRQVSKAAGSAAVTAIHGTGRSLAAAPGAAVAPGADAMRNVIGETPAMRRLGDSIRTVAFTDASVLIQGETGTGKELIARAIHGSSGRHRSAMVTINCAALPRELLESELFGHEKGAFTGACQQRRGRFELADGGTVFLDEIGELPLDLQPRLLRVLQEREFERVGGNQPIAVDVRLITATNRDLAAMVAAGKFRSDLFYRLNVFPLTMPPLRERRADIPLLARHFLDECARKLDKPLREISPDTLTALLEYAWPGNVRELQNVIERLAIMASGAMLDDDVRPMLTGRRQLPACAPKCSEDTVARTFSSLSDMTRRHIEQVLQHCDGIIEGETGAAAILDISPSTLRHRMKKLGLSRAGLPRARHT